MKFTCASTFPRWHFETKKSVPKTQHFRIKWTSVHVYVFGFFCSYFENVLYALYEPIKFRSVYSRNRVRMQNLFSILWHFHLPKPKIGGKCAFASTECSITFWALDCFFHFVEWIQNRSQCCCCRLCRWDTQEKSDFLFYKKCISQFSTWNSNYPHLVFHDW